MRKIFALLLVTLVGCAKTAMITGAATALAGAMLVTASPQSSCQPATGPNATENSFTNGICNTIATGADGAAAFADRVIGTSLIVLGAALLVGGMIADDGPRAEVKRVAIARPAPPIARPMPSTVEANAALASRVENRLAIQASLVAHAGQCQAAKVTADRLAALDPPLFQALMSRDLELAQCYGR